jgi:hypothetical protein
MMGKERRGDDARIALLLGFLEQMLRRIFASQRGDLIRNFVNSAFRQIFLR